MHHFKLASPALALALVAAPMALAQDEPTAEATTEAAPAEATTDAAPAEVVEYDVGTVLATVNGADITLGHVASMVRRLPPQYQEIADQDLFNGVLQQLVEQEMMRSALAERGPLPKALALSIENESRALAAQQIANEFYEIPLSDEEMQDGYQEAIASIPVTAEYSAAHILVETEDEAKSIAEEAAGGADFAELAKEKSVGPSGPNGGELGWFGEGQMVPEFEAAVMALEDGAISEPIQTQFGWHVIKLNESREKPKPTFDELKSSIEEKLRRLKVEEQLEALREASEIKMQDDGFPAEAIRDQTIFDAE